jgi:CRP/FNR family transcriptional regulator, anaerobic regulatory protein
MQNKLTSIKELLGKNGIATANIEKIIAVLKPMILKKGEVFNKIGKRADKLGILIEGLLIAKYENASSADDIISRFYYSPRNIIVASFESFYSGNKSNETIEAVEDSYLTVINREDLYSLYNQIPEMNKIGRQLAEESYILALQRIHQLQAMNAKERLENFQQCHPELANRIKIQHLCSYLGVNRNALSRLMGEKRK